MINIKFDKATIIDTISSKLLQWFTIPKSGKDFFFEKHVSKLIIFILKKKKKKGGINITVFIVENFNSKQYKYQISGLFHSSEQESIQIQPTLLMEMPNATLVIFVF